MASTRTLAHLKSLPQYMTASWRSGSVDQDDMRARLRDDQWTVSALSEAFLKLNVGRSDEGEELGQVNDEPPTLSSMSAAKVNDVLEGSDNVEKDIQTIAKSLNTVTLRQILRDPRTSYRILRSFLMLPPGYGPSDAAETTSRLVDIDEAVLSNERYVRAQGRTADLENRQYLVTLEELVKVVGNSKDADGNIVITRKDPPKGGFEFLDTLRKKSIKILPDSSRFAATFDRITKGILSGLDWNNVLVAGGMAQVTLMHTDQSEDGDELVQDSDIDIYLYGLSPEDANKKVEHIYDTWKRNLPTDNVQTLVVKNAKTINFFADYPSRRIQVVLKLLANPTQILLNFDIDACAIAWNGSQVLMLPRCARAIETGYSVFTMDLIWGHHLGDRRATQEVRIFKYADRGFGMRILPSYARSLENDGLEDLLVPKTSNRNLKASRRPGIRTSSNFDSFRHPGYDNLTAYRKPQGAEPGLKTLKRIAYRGQDYVNRFLFGITPLLKYYRELGDDDAWWNEQVETQKERLRADKEHNDKARESGDTLNVPQISLAMLDMRDTNRNIPTGRRGLSEFEVFMRHCEVWRLDAREEVSMDETEISSTVYDPETYDNMPDYEWGTTFSARDFAGRIDIANDYIFNSLKHAICDKLLVDFIRNGYNGYLTRRIRRQIHGPDLASVMGKQIVVPMIIPFEFENYIKIDLLPSDPDVPSHMTQNPLIIPIHDPDSEYTGPIPAVPDTADEPGNLRYWVITNESMWAGQSRTVDEMHEVLWSLFHSFNQARQWGIERYDALSAVCYVAKSFRRRMVLPEVHGFEERGLENTQGGHRPTLREALLFRPWVMSEPPSLYRDYTESDSIVDLFNEDGAEYPFADALFWNPGDEGVWDEENVPQWVEWNKEGTLGEEGEEGVEHEAKRVKLGDL